MLTVVSANLQHAYMRRSPLHWQWRKDAVKEFLQSVEPHVVCTQELVLETINDMESMFPQWEWVGLGRRGEHRGEFVAIFFNKERLTVQKSGTFWLSKKPDKPGSSNWFSVFPCICTWADLTDNETKKTIRFYNTHLDHISPFARLNGLKVIRNHVEKHCEGLDGVVLTGDFNTPPNSRPIKYFHSCEDYNVVMKSAITDGRTFHAFSMKEKGKPIDYIFTSKNIEIEKSYIDRRSFGGKYPSDHFPLVAEIEVAAEN